MTTTAGLKIVDSGGWRGVLLSANGHPQGVLTALERMAVARRGDLEQVTQVLSGAALGWERLGVRQNLGGPGFRPDLPYDFTYELDPAARTLVAYRGSCFHEVAERIGAVHFDGQGQLDGAEWALPTPTDAQVGPGPLDVSDVALPAASREHASRIDAALEALLLARVLSPRDGETVEGRWTLEGPSGGPAWRRQVEGSVIEVGVHAELGPLGNAMLRDAGGATRRVDFGGLRFWEDAAEAVGDVGSPPIRDVVIALAAGLLEQGGRAGAVRIAHHPAPMIHFADPAHGKYIWRSDEGWKFGALWSAPLLAWWVRRPGR